MKEIFLYRDVVEILEHAGKHGWALPHATGAPKRLTWGADVEQSALRYLAGHDIIAAPVDDAQEAFEAFLAYDLKPSDTDVAGALKERLYADPEDSEAALAFEYYSTRL